MPLRPIDAIFVDPKRRLYVVYYRGALWQLPRMKIDDKAWQRRVPYVGAPSDLYLSHHQTVHDTALAQKLRTLHLPEAVRGATLPRFEAWWEQHGFEWLKDILDAGESPLAAHHEIMRRDQSAEQTDNPQQTNHTTTSAPESSIPKNSASSSADPAAVNMAKVKTIHHTTDKNESSDIFGNMLAELVDEVRHHEH